MEYIAQEVLRIETNLGECPLWSVQEQVLYFVDILKPAIYRFTPMTKHLQEYLMPEDTGCIGLRKSGGFIAAMRSGVFLLDNKARIVQKIAANPTNPKYSRFNDGRVDPWGHFWCGTIWEAGEEQNAKICRISKAGQAFEVVLENLNIANGIAFSPNNKWMYYTDTPANSLYCVKLDEKTGEPVGQAKQVYHFGTGRPDGAAFDSLGNYWTAQYGDGVVLCLSPQGEIIHQVKVPAKQVTMVAFGGKELNTLFITTARENMSQQELREQPQAGNLFAVTVHAKGLSEPLFNG